MAKGMTTEARKKDTREKIEFGGLIVKAGLRYEKRALLLGLLIDASKRIKDNETERSRLTSIGVEAFGNDSE
ncbi:MULTISPECIES: type IV conjugative transfer system coupling protein TraD [Rhizobium/Agrobacterium group]|uniref:type IV conjugative transfer system coupling protein TraD n=1 Tax=Rhizobium/Agrobacterium group TaxID=227290 RepID=UPI0008DBFF80|nr:MULTISPECIES: type IV conjugative transfer system coupling protein TraD [Rhizobium/Agrobacterium group]NSX99059.1 type IV conjugative transfer system coupling protein TraD [Agrobacterium vitis]NSZ19875.1 type IV conjugative transfer system coupling protein TraD [Agrobacterium vitis]NSZ30198.1 type IV conjugative transfer system coupling protein TraD [Agrobacterium vitis]NSZ45623.1 type IV conjugative transfer system coupling protein TraD [Agrobacterium vitis]NSZ55284.1 type IV conjugative t